jgi:tetratricopeptide (TPR) repeat protein
VTTPFSDPLVGRTIAQYSIEARIGGGAMGVVYQARDTKLGRPVALKFLPQQWSHDENAKQRFVREAQAASATHHPNICTIHDIETADDGQLFIVMAFYEGPTLKQRLESGPMAIDEALEIATQIADGLAKAHAQGVVHRDIKPGNVILTEEGVRILDFGLATFVDALKLTAENASFGTPAYMSPEQVRGQTADARSDVWAVGVVLYEMLAGHVPFQGAYVEAVGHAIRNEAPLPLRSSRPDVAEEIEQLVFRALHKEPSVRYGSGRELARALRQVRGLSVPVELRTQPVPVSQQSAHGRRMRWRRVGAIAAAIALAVAAFVVWVLRPVDRLPIAIVPVVNQTGYADLDGDRLGLTLTLISALRDSTTVRAISHEQLLSIVRRFRTRGKDVSSGEALQALKEHTGARALVVVTMLNDGSGFRARLEFRNPETLTNEGAAFETPPQVSTLVREAAFSLVGPVVDGIEQRFMSRVPLRARVADFMRRAAGRVPAHMTPTHTLETAADLERGLDSYEELEYVAARTALDAASQREPLNPVLVAWRGRIARLMRRDVDAETLARQAVSLVNDDTPVLDRLFVEAVAAEARRDIGMAEGRYASLRRLYPDDPAILAELAAFQDRQGKNADAIATHHATLALDSHLVRPHMDLCRLYNRINQPVDAREHGRRAVAGYESLGSEGGTAQALMCLTDALRVGDDAERNEAVTHAERALEIVKRLNYSHNLARAFNYVALSREAQGNLDEAARMWEQALTAADAAGNVVLAPLILMNLGATNANLGNHSVAITYLRRSASAFELLGERARAAENQFNIGALLIQYGGDSKEGLRLLQDAVEVFKQLGNRTFEVVAAQVTATYYRHAGRYMEAERELNRALNLANERDLHYEAATASIRLGQTRFEMGEYDDARRVLMESIPKATSRDQVSANIYLAKTLVSLGDFSNASDVLARTRLSLRKGRDAGLLASLYVALGELAYERRRLEEAREYFTRAADHLTPDLPDLDALQARAYIGLLDAEAGSHDRAWSIVNEVLMIAERIGHVSLEVRCRLFLTQIDLARGRVAPARAHLAAIRVDDESRAIGRELRAQVLYWRGRAIEQSTKIPRPSPDVATARKMLLDMAEALPPSYRATFLKRPAIAKIVG